MRGSEKKDYELREMTAAARDSYMDKLRVRMRLDASGNPVGIEKYEGLQTDLLILCMWDLGTGKPITRGEIQEWPSSTVTQLYNAAQEMHKLPGAEEAAAAKNA